MRYFGVFRQIVLIVLILLVAQMPAHAYIDPGTGSMLFSIVLGVITTLFFLAQSLFMKLKMLFLSNKDLCKDNIPFVIYSEGKQYFNVFKPIVDEFESRKIPLVFYTSSQDDPIFKESYEFVKAEYIGQAFDAYMKLAFLRADVCLMTTPGLDVYHLKRSKYVKYYCHIFHSVSTSMFYRLFALDYYDGVLCNGSFQPALVRELEQKRNLPAKDIEVVGCTYLDVSAKKLDGLPVKANNRTVLLAPTWGESGILSKYGTKLLDKFADADYDVIIRPHPQSLKVERKLLDDLKSHYENHKNIKWNYDLDNLSVLSQADIMISDFSGVMFDYMFLFNRPVIFINNEINREIYDVSDLEGEPWSYSAIRELGVELTKDNFQNISELIADSLQKCDRRRIADVKSSAWVHQFESGKYATDFLINKQKEISKC